MPYADPEQQRIYQREWIAERRAAWIAANGPCAACGSDDRLEVDHIDPAQKVTHRVWSWAPERLAAELAKCQVLCRECHRKKSYGDNVGRHGHGDHRTYKQAGCRCQPCTTAATAFRRASRQRAFAARLEAASRRRRRG